MIPEGAEPATRTDLVALESRMLQRMEASELRMLERMEAIETQLLRAFQQRAVPVNGRLRKLEAGDGVLDERLAMIEERIFTIEKTPGSVLAAALGPLLTYEKEV